MVKTEKSNGALFQDDGDDAIDQQELLVEVSHLRAQLKVGKRRGRFYVFGCVTSYWSSAGRKRQVAPDGVGEHRAQAQGCRPGRTK